MTAAINTEALGVTFALPPVRQEFPDNNVELRLRWIPIGTDGIVFAAFDTGVTADAVEYHNPGASAPLIFSNINFLIVRIRPYDDLLPASGSVVVILTDLLHAGGVNSMNSPALESGSVMVLAQSNPYATVATTALQLSSTDAVNIAVDLLISGIG